MIKSFLLLCSALIITSANASNDWLSLKPGLWETKTTTVQPGQTNNSPPMTASMCIDQSVQKEMMEMGQGMAKMCSKNERRRDGARMLQSMECDMAGSKIKTQSVITFKSDSEYTTEAKSIYEPPLMGIKEATTRVEAKHIGTCKSGQKPGDMVLPTGQTINIKGMMGK